MAQETGRTERTLRARDRVRGFLHPPAHHVNDGDEGEGEGRTHDLVESIKPNVERGEGFLRLGGRQDIHGH